MVYGEPYDFHMVDTSVPPPSYGCIINRHSMQPILPAFGTGYGQVVIPVQSKVQISPPYMQSVWTPNATVNTDSFELQKRIDFEKMRSAANQYQHPTRLFPLTKGYCDPKYETTLPIYQSDQTKLKKIEETCSSIAASINEIMKTNEMPSLMSVNTSNLDSRNPGSSAVVNIDQVNAYSIEKKDENAVSQSNTDLTNSMETLEGIYLEQVRCSDHNLLASLVVLITTSVMKHMMLESANFAELYGDIELNFDDINSIKHRNKKKEFALSLILKPKDPKLEIVDLGNDPKKPYLGRIRRYDRAWPKDADKEIYFVSNDDGHVYLSPQKIFNLLQTTVDKALTTVSSRIEVDGHKYNVIRTVSDPLSLEIDNANVIDKESEKTQSRGLRCKINIFPEIKLDFTKLPIDFTPPMGGVRDRIMFLRREFKCDEMGTFSAVAFISAEDKDKFVLKFHESVENAILNENNGSVKIILEIIQHIRVRYFPVLDVQLLKTCLMWIVLERKHILEYWNKKNLEACLINILTEILARMDSGWVPDLILTTHNLLTTLLDKYNLSEQNFVSHVPHYKDMDRDKVQPQISLGMGTLKNVTSRGVSILKDVNIWGKQWNTQQQDVRQLKALIKARRWLRTRLERYHKNQNIRVFFL